MTTWRVRAQDDAEANCAHVADLTAAAEPATRCEDCVQEGTTWIHLRRCMSCGHVGCCDSSPRRHASAHWRSSDHAVAGSAEPGEHWAWCYSDQVLLVPQR